MANEVAVVSEAERSLIMNVLGGKLVQDIEFSQLDSAIENIAAHTEALSDGERESAARLIEKFEDRVVSTISNKADTLSEFYNALHEAANMSYRDIEYTLDNYGAQYHMLFQQQGLDDLDAMLTKVEEGIAEITEKKQTKAPEEPFIDKMNMTPLEVAKLEMDYNLEKSKFENALDKERYIVRRNFYDFAMAMNKNVKIKQFRKLLKDQAEASKNAKTIVKEKASAASMAILIGDADIRKALQSFHEFAATVM